MGSVADSVAAKVQSIFEKAKGIEHSKDNSSLHDQKDRLETLLEKVRYKK